MMLRLSGRCRRLPARTPLRTVRESFPSYGSSRSDRCALSRARGGNRATSQYLLAL
jgi:hypothetical protein